MDQAAPYQQLAQRSEIAGKGHLAEAKAAINSPRAAMNGAQSVFQRREENHSSNGGGSCGGGDTSERDALLAKIAEAKKSE